MKLTINGATIEVDNNKISEALEKGEGVEVKSDQLVKKDENTVIYSKDDFDRFIENKTKERYEAGKEVGEKEAVKEVSEKFGVNLEEKKKTIANFAEDLKARFENEYIKEESEKLKELKSDNEQLKNKVQEWEGKYNEFNEKVNQERRQARTNQIIAQNMPEKDYILGKDKLQTLFKSEYTVELDENDKPIVKKGGEVLKDENTLDPLPVKSVMENFVKDYVKTPEGGDGGGDEAGAPKAGTIDAFKKEMETKNIRPGSEAYNQELQKRVQEKTIEV